MKTGDVVTLKGISRHGKNRISEQGAQWVVVRVEARPSSGSRNGSCLCVGSGFVLLEKEDKSLGFWRWVALADDKNFSIEEG